MYQVVTGLLRLKLVVAQQKPRLFG